MEKGLRFFFDKEGDTLDISIGNPTDAVSRELENDIVVRIDPATKKIIGFTILNFEKRFRHLGSEEILPINADFSQLSESSTS